MHAARNVLSIWCALFWAGLVWLVGHNRPMTMATFVACAVVTYIVLAIVQHRNGEATP